MHQKRDGISGILIVIIAAIILIAIVGIGFFIIKQSNDSLNIRSQQETTSSTTQSPFVTNTTTLAFIQKTVGDFDAGTFSSTTVIESGAGASVVLTSSTLGSMLSNTGIKRFIPVAIAFDGTNMWTANAGDNSVTKITLLSSGGSPVMTTYSGTGSGTIAIAFDGTNMWTANNTDNSVTKITPSGNMTTYSGTGLNPVAIAFDGTNMWTANAGDNSVTKITPSGDMTTYSKTGFNPSAIAFDGANMWTANFGDDSVTRITSLGNMTTYSGTNSKPGKNSEPVAIAFDGTNMWTANAGDNSVTRIPIGAYYPSGIFTSSIINIGMAHSYGTVAWTNSGSGSITMQVRSASSSLMTSATAWGTCSIANGGLFSTDPCIHNGDIYIQYQAILSRATVISLGTLLPQANPFQSPSLDSVTITN